LDPRTLYFKKTYNGQGKNKKMKPKISAFANSLAGKPAIGAKKVK
jgi:hypothetical protein